MREFSGQIFTEKQTRKQKRKIPEKISEGCQIQGKKETQKFIQHTSEDNCTCFERQEKHIQLYRNSWPPLSAAISSQKQQRNKFLSSHCSLVLLCSLQGKIVHDGRLKSICEVKTFWCLRSCPACTIKHVPALLQTAVSFHIPYSVNEKSSLLLCPGFRNINLRTPGSFGTLFPRGSDELSREICTFTASKQLQ